MVKKKRKEEHHQKSIYLFFLIIIALFIFIYTFFPHINYPYPLHFDEWTHASNVERIKDITYIPFIEIGFDSILLLISLIVPLLHSYQFFAAINTLLISAIIFYHFTRQKQFYTGIFAVLAFASLPTNINILGIRFFVPITAAIAFIYLSLFSVESKKKRKWMYVTVYLLLIGFIHTSSIMVIGLTLSIYLIMKKEFLQKWMYLVPAAMFTSLIGFLLLIFHKTDFVSLMNTLVWKEIYDTIIYDPFRLIGYPLALLGIWGFYSAWKKKTYLAFRIYYIIALCNIIIFTLFRFSLFSAYQRYIYHFFIASIILSAVGFKSLYDFIKEKDISNIMKDILIVAIVMLTFYCAFFNGYEKSIPKDIYYTITSDEVDAYQSLDGLEYGLVLTPKYHGANVKLISGQEGVYDFFSFRREERLHEFYTSNCSTKKEMIDNGYFYTPYNKYDYKTPIRYIFSKEKMNCSFLTEHYGKHDNYIFIVNSTKDDEIFSVKDIISAEEKREFVLKEHLEDFMINLSLQEKNGGVFYLTNGGRERIITVQMENTTLKFFAEQQFRSIDLNEKKGHFYTILIIKKENEYDLFVDGEWEASIEGASYEKKAFPFIYIQRDPTHALQHLTITRRNTDD